MEGAEREALAGRLHSVAIQLLRRVRREDERSGLGPARLSALSVLVFGGPRTLGELAAAEQVSAPTMSRLVAGLEGEGYVVREPNPEDGRSVMVRATARARAVLDEARRRRIGAILELLGELPAEDWDRLGVAVEVLKEALEAQPRRPPPPRPLASPVQPYRSGGPDRYAQS